VILYAIYYWGIAAVIDIPHKIPEIQKIIKKEFGADVEIKQPNLKMGLIPSAWVSASHFKIINKTSSPLLVSNPKIKIQLLPLLIGKVKISYFSCDKLNLNLKIDKNNRIYIGQHLIVKNSNPGISIEDSKMYIQNYEINFNDEIQNKKIFLNGNYFNLEKYNSKKYIKFSTNSKLKIGQTSSIINTNINFKLPFKKGFGTNDIIFDGLITNLNLKELEPYIIKLSKNKIKNINGILNLQTDTQILNQKTNQIKTQMVLDNLSFNTQNNQEKIYFQDKLNIFTTIKVSKNILILQEFKILSGRINAKISGEINKVSSKSPVLDLSLIIDKARTEDLIPLLPAKDYIWINLIALKKYGYFSDFKGKLYIKGKSEKPNFSGDFLLGNGYLNIIFPPSIPKVSAKICVSGSKILLDFIVPTSQKDNILLKGYIKLDDKEEINLKIKSTSNIDLKIFKSILLPVHEIFNFNLGPLPKMQLEGIGNIDLKVNGNRKDINLVGVVNFKDTTASFIGINAKLKNSLGYLKFQNKNTNLMISQSFLKNIPIKAKGQCSLNGVLDYNIETKNQDWKTLLNIIDTSPLLTELKKLVPPNMQIIGNFDSKLQLTGKVNNINEFHLGKNVFLEGNIKLLKNNIIFSNIETFIPNLSGDINLRNSKYNFKLQSQDNKSKIIIQGEIENQEGNFEIKGDLNQNLFNLKCNIKNIFKQNQIINAKFISDNFDLANLTKLKQTPFIGENIKKYLNKISNASGKINLNVLVKNNILSSKIQLNDISLTYSNVPIKIFSGYIELNNDKLTLYKINSNIDSMPVLLDGFITNIFKTLQFNIYINSKLSQDFIEKYINKKAIYPLKIKGDVIYSGRISGTKNLINAKSEINLPKDSYISYMGSSLGDANNPIRIYADTNISKNSLYVKIFQYDKLISSQNNREFVSPQLNAKGQINFKNNDITFSDFKIKTQNPTDARIFNLLFKKSMIKQGLFNANLTINNSINFVRMSGFLTFSGINIPIVDTVIKDISLNFGEKTIDIKANGEIFSNKIILLATVINKLTPPYIFNDINIYLESLNLNKIFKKLNKLEIEADMNNLDTSKSELTEFKCTDIIIKKAKIKADSVLLKNILAKNLLADFSLNDKLLFSVNNFNFDVSEGKIKGRFRYNLLSSVAELEMDINKANANSIAETLFDLNNQIFGSLIGEVNLICNGKTHKTCMDTLTGDGKFRVINGKMPKLGSLEYLLKSVNLVKSGVTGLTINSLIDLVTPLKTGEFENINGNFSIKSGFADDIQIFSKGKDLSIFLTGTYNFSTFVANMNIFGRISKKITNILGPIGNTSINTLFNIIPGFNLDETNKAEFVKNLNKIPGFELNDKSYRIFSAEIYGDINGEDYVQSFKWIE
jgi:hypothetical protein